MAKKFIVDRISEDCIRVYPEKQDEALRQCEVKKRRVTMYDYGKGNGFSITPQSLKSNAKAGTIFKIKDYPCCTLHQSKNKFFIRVNFTKATLADAKMIIQRDVDEWFKFLQEKLSEEAAEAVAEAADKKNKNASSQVSQVIKFTCVTCVLALKPKNKKTMIGYINSVRDREYKLCTPEIFESLVSLPMVTTHIEECRKGNAASKSLLPAFLFQGYDPNVLLGKKGSRLAKALRPTGFFIMDFDHVSTTSPQPSPQGEGEQVTPLKLYDRFLQRLPSLGLDLKRNVALAHITPSGDGLRLVLVTPKGMTIEAAQEWVAKIMGIECDAVVKDLSRLSFCPQASDILYINKQLLFSPTPALPDREGVPNTPAVNPHDQQDIPKALPLSGGDGGGLFPETYNSIPYKKIVEELILLHGGEPQVGNRENTIFRLASDLAKITDRSAPWLESLIPTFGLPESEWRNTIAQVCKKPLETGISRKLQDAIKCCEQMQKELEDSAPLPLGGGDGGGALPPSMPSVLPPLIEHLVSNVPEHLKAAVCMMSFPALAAHVSNCKFQMLDGTEEELGLAACLLAKQSGGKSSVKKPIELIMADIDQADDISRERLRLWAEKRKNKKANEKGEPKPRVPIRWLDEDITSAAFFERLGCAEDGDEGRPNQCCYTHCNELEKLYNFNSRGGKAEIRQTIKGAFDRDRVGSCRATADAVNEKTFLRWNWTACSTIENGKDFFSGKMVTDGAVSRVDFCTIIPPAQKQRYQIARYDKTWRDKLAPYVKNLNDFKCETDENGDLIASLIPESITLEEYLDNLTGERNAEMVDDVYEDYGRRCRVMTVKKMITLYIAHGCKWLPEFDAFAKWMFDYSMWCKMAFFYSKASEAFTSERVVFKGHWSPLKLMRKEFTFSEFVAVCQKNADKFKRTPSDAIYTYRHRGLIRQEGNKYIIADSFCAKHGIK